MRVAFVNQPWNQAHPPVAAGSIAIWTREVARRLADPCSVTVYGRGGWLRWRSLEAEGVRYRLVPMLADRLRQRLPAARSVDSRRPRFATPSFYRGYGAHVARDLQRHGGDVVHVHNLSQLVPQLRARNPSMRIVLHMHCEWLTQLDRDLIEPRIGQADALVGCSEHVAGAIRDVFPDLAPRVHAVHNGVDPQHFTASDGVERAAEQAGGRILFVGRISPEKGVHVLLEALETVARQRPGIIADLIGPRGAMPREYAVDLSDDPAVRELTRFEPAGYAAHVEREIAARGLEKQVRLRGAIPYEQLREHYREADVFVFPSVWNEPFGMPIVEAMACRLPVVATRGGGIAEIVADGVTGLLVERADAGALAAALLRLLEDDSRRRTMGAAGRARVEERFTWDVVAQRVAKLHDLVVGGGQP